MNKFKNAFARIKESKRSKRSKTITTIILVIVIGAGGIFSYFQLKKSNNSDNIHHNNFTVKVENGTIQETITASGLATLEDETYIYGEADGYKISKFLVEEGDIVKKGQNLVEYDVDDTKTELENKIRDAKRNIVNGKLALEAITTPKTEAEITQLQNSVFTQQKAITEAQTVYDSYNTKLSLQQTTIDNAKKDIESAERTVSQAQTDLEQAKKDMDNAEDDVNIYKQLLSIGGISQSEYDNYETSYDKAKSAYQQAENTLANAQNSLEKSKANLTDAQNSYNDILTEKENKKLDITSAQKALTLAQQQLEQAENPLSDSATKIKYDQQVLTNQGLEDSLEDYEEDLAELVQYTTSPVDGTVTEISADENSFIVENTVMLKITNIENLIVEADIEEYDAPLLELGQKVTMTSDGLDGKTYTGKIIKISPTASVESTNMGSETVVPIEISVENPDGMLKSGYNLDLEIMVVDKEDVPVVSTNAIGTDVKTGSKYVYKVENNTIVKTEVETGDEGDSTIEILSGIDIGDTIIPAVSDTIQDGMSYDEYEKLMSKTQQDAHQKKEQSDNEENKSSEEIIGGSMRNGNNRSERSGQMLPSGGFGNQGPGMR